MTRARNFIVDTNTLVSSLLLKNSTSFKALEKVHELGLLIFSDDTFLEFELVLLRKKFDRYFSKEERLQIIERIYREGTFMMVEADLHFSRDPKDDKFLALALAIKADCIITGDKDLLDIKTFGKTKITTITSYLSKE